VAFLETASRPSSLLAGAAARFIFGIPTLSAIRIVGIEGETKVTGVTIESAAGIRTLACDGVVFSGDWVPESTLLRSSHIGIDPATKGPAVDAYYRTRDPQVFAAGNVLRWARSAGSCALEGRSAARAILADFQHRLPLMGRNELEQGADPADKHDLVIPTGGKCCASPPETQRTRVHDPNLDC